MKIDLNSLPGKRAVENAAIVAHEANRYYCQAIGDHSQVGWADAPPWQRDSAINGVIQIVHDPDTTPEESHDNWCQEKRAAGWVHGAKKDPEATPPTHPCLVEYEELPVAQQRKDAIYGAVVREALYCYEPRLFQEAAGKIADATTPYAAVDPYKQVGMAHSMGRVNRICQRGVDAYLRATGYVMPSFVRVSPGFEDMVMMALAGKTIERAYSLWRAGVWPYIVPDLPGCGDTHVGAPAMDLHGERIRGQWFLIYGITKAVAWIEGIEWASRARAASAYRSKWIVRPSPTDLTSEAVQADVTTEVMMKGAAEVERAADAAVVADVTPAGDPP